MKRWIAASPTLRALAIIIALAGAIDPAITSKHAGRPTVSVIAADQQDAALVDRVARSLDGRFTVSRAAFSAGDATVIVGDRLPREENEMATPVFAVFDERAGPAVTLDGVRAPAAAPADSRVPVEAVARVSGARGRTVDFTLRAGRLVVDRVSRAIAGDDQRETVTLAYVPAAAGVAPLRVTASIAGVPAAAAADVVVDVRDQRWAVLFYDPRPSWMSTFVRRAAERDQRFIVTSRIVTSRDLSADAGQPPRLDDLAALELFDAVVVGAPEALSERDVAGLEAFMRRRGGGVLLLLDHRAAGPYDRLAGVGAWTTDSASRARAIVPVSGDSSGLRASEMAFPTRLPATAVPLALTAATARDSSSNRAIVWRSSVGAGRLIVSGALDSWRYRDRAVSAFDRFWQSAVADAASASPAAIGVVVSSPAARPGESVDVSVSVRGAALSAGATARASVTATLVSDSGAPTAVRLWPSGAVGQFRGSVRAPLASGVYRLAVTGNGARGSSPLVVIPNAARPSPNDRDVVASWVLARNGKAVSSSQLNDLANGLDAAIHATSRAETWHPMRSVWWLLPFALALCAEWWLRRRRGLS